MQRLRTVTSLDVSAVAGHHAMPAALLFQIRKKSGNFVDGQGNLERTWKVREKSGNLKINGYGRQSSKKYSVQEGKACTFSLDSLSPFLPHRRLLLKERICSHGEQILSFKSNPKFEVIQLAVLKANSS